MNLKDDEEEKADPSEKSFKEKYLTVDKAEYINKAEYGSDNHNEESGVEDIKEAGFQTNFDEDEHSHTLGIQREWEDNETYEQRNFHILPDGNVVEKGYEHSPIGETSGENRSTPSREGYPGDDDLLKISQEVKKKDQSRKLVLWEQSEMRNQWEDTMATAKKQEAALKKNSNVWDLPNKTRP